MIAPVQTRVLRRRLSVARLRQARAACRLGGAAAVAVLALVVIAFALGGCELSWSEAHADDAAPLAGACSCTHELVAKVPCQGTEETGWYGEVHLWDASPLERPPVAYLTDASPSPAARGQVNVAVLDTADGWVVRAACEHPAQRLEVWRVGGGAP